MSTFIARTDPSHDGEKSCQSVETQTIELFGGSMHCTLPITFKDTSTLRPVPDNQEVWLSPDFSDGCFIVELLQYQEEAAEENPLPYFFHDLANHNSVQEGKYWLLEDSCKNFHNLPVHAEQPFALGDAIAHANEHVVSTNGASIYTGIGVQCVSSKTSDIQRLPPPFDQLQPREEPSWIQIELCLIRLNVVKTDILITLSRPLMGAPTVSSASNMSGDVNCHGTQFEDTCRSFSIVDWTLFG